MSATSDPMQGEDPRSFRAKGEGDRTLCATMGAAFAELVAAWHRATHPLLKQQLLMSATLVQSTLCGYAEWYLDRAVRAAVARAGEDAVALFVADLEGQCGDVELTVDVGRDLPKALAESFTRARVRVKRGGFSV